MTPSDSKHTTSPSTDKQKPNLLWIFVDQLRFHSLSCHGDTNIETPHIDRLCREGVSFKNATTTCPVCTPARGAVLTGQYCNQNDILYLGDLLEPAQKTVAHHFNDAGYQTSYVGKWHLSSQQNPFGHNEGAEYWVHPKLRGGFKDWYGFELSNHFWKTRYSTGDRMWPPLLIDGYQTDGLVDIGLDYLTEHMTDTAAPWFQVMSLETPHHGSDANDISKCKVGDKSHARHPAPQAYEDQFTPDHIALRDNVPDFSQDVAKSMLSQYYAMIKNLDDNIGRILDWLDTHNLADSTVIAFFSDHGEMGGSHGRFQKGNPYDESLRIPIIMRGPGIEPQPDPIDEPINLIDLFPTCAGLCGLSQPDNVAGLDYSALLAGEKTAIRSSSLSQWFGSLRYGSADKPGVQWRCIRTKQYTYARWENEEHQLFDNQTDPSQLNNIYQASNQSTEQTRLHQLLIEEIQNSGEAVPRWVGE